MKPTTKAKVGGTSRFARMLFAQAALAAALMSGASAETLQQALAQAYAANPTLNAQRAAARATDESVPQALSGYRPQVAASADFGYSASRTRSPTGAIVDSGTRTASTGLTVLCRTTQW